MSLGRALFEVYLGSNSVVPQARSAWAQGARALLATEQVGLLPCARRVLDCKSLPKVCRGSVLAALKRTRSARQAPMRSSPRSR